MYELFIPNIIAYPNAYNHLLHHIFHDKMPTRKLDVYHLL